MTGPTISPCWVNPVLVELAPLLEGGIFSMSVPGVFLLRSAGVHQYIGYWRWMLLISKDDTRVRIALSSTNGSRYHPSCDNVGSTAASSAVAPAGGYTVSVNVIAAEASPHDRAPASQRRFSKFELSMKSFVTQTPTRAERKWPNKPLRGWAKGDEMKLYSRMAAAPY